MADEKNLAPVVVTANKPNKYLNVITDGNTTENVEERKPDVDNKYVTEIIPFSSSADKNLEAGYTNPWAWMGAGAVAGVPTSKVASSVAKNWMDINQLEKPYSNLWGEKTGYGLYDPEGVNTTRAQSERYQKQFRTIGEGRNKIEKARLMNLDKALEEIKYREAFQNRPKVVQAGEKFGQLLQRYPKLAGALSGAGALGEGAEAYNRWNQGDYPGAVISGLGALGSGASMLPAVTPWTAAAKGIGATVGAVSPLALMAYDYMRK